MGKRPPEVPPGVAQAMGRGPWGWEDGPTGHPDFTMTFLTGEHKFCLKDLSPSLQIP